MYVQKCPDPRYTQTDARVQLLLNLYIQYSNDKATTILNIHATVPAKHKWHMYIIGVGAWGPGGPGGPGPLQISQRWAQMVFGLHRFQNQSHLCDL